ncbi:MAG: ECF transporter S component [Bacilli bacterium]
MMTKNSKLIFDMVLIGIFAALSFVITVYVSIPIPGTSGAGYLNLSDVFIFVLAALVNPWVGGLVGGVSGMLSDLFLGYSYFAPFTLMIKFIEGIVAGYLFRALTISGQATRKTYFWKSLIAFVVGGIVMAGLYMIPDYITYINIPGEAPGGSYTFIFFDLGFNSIQGVVDAVLGSLIFVGLYNIPGLANRHREEK